MRYEVQINLTVVGDCSPREAMEAAVAVLGRPSYDLPLPTETVKVGRRGDEEREVSVDPTDIAVRRIGA